MKIQKNKIMDLPSVYSTAELKLTGKRYLTAISEARNEHAYIIDPITLEYSDLWIGDTGVMNIIQIPGREQMLVITKFYPVFQSRDACICLLEPTANGYMSPWKMTEVFPLPFCHRIGIVKNKNGLFVICCQLCHDKDFQEDWTQPGAIWMAPIPETTTGEWKLTKVFDGLTKNHGLFIENNHQVYISCENGVMLFDMSCYQSGDVLQPKLLTTAPTSDLWIAQDGGERIVGAIEPFHGDNLSIYSLTNTEYNKKRTDRLHFGHVVWVGKVFGELVAIVGNRGGAQTLDLIFLHSDKTLTIDKNVGPTQITVYEDGNEIKILSANHGAGEVSLYTLCK